MERIVERTYLYDFYGDLLTEHQRRIYEAVVLNDTGYSEVAVAEGISRQGVHDMVRRCDRQLDEYEEKLQLLRRFLKIRGLARKIIEAADTLSGDKAEEIKALSEGILEEL